MSPRVGSHESRCQSCMIRPDLCFCAEVPRLRLRTQVSFVMHYLEGYTTTNTARWAALALEGTRFLLRGRPGHPVERFEARPGHQPLLLYPGQGARELTPALLEDLRARSGGLPFELVVPDGSWRQASRAAKRVPGLEGVPRVKLPEGGRPSRYRLRREPREECVSTYEAVARALGILEAAEVQARLERVFDLMVDRALFSRGGMPPAQFLASGSAPEGFSLSAYGAGAAAPDGDALV